ncbi:hypothetical protein [Paraglaciecola sp. MB-3u-78]|uniref:hypothetical protein n=1 Tax=Paraglaciecola sp. MB-3u-78 TaxID=2058332 RepID=UPI000C33A3D9|nr:hypothetical protein [Paraglaciecola sp. MB-3u-78]PKG93058.1 hypothetical protein CXF95_29340 [Paraglaciecola sp. MB-3u-78]
MKIRAMAEVGARLEKAVMANLDESLTPREIYNAYEEVAISILDSEFDDYPEDTLEQYLRTFLYHKELDLGLDIESGDG